MYKLSQNRFVKGINQDIDPRMQNTDTYRKAVNMALTGDGDFFSLRNINGTEVLSQLEFNTPKGELNILAAYEADGVYRNVYDNEEVNSSIVIFAHNDDGANGSSAIFLYDTVRFEMYKIIEDEGLNFKPDATIDAVIEGEGGIDIVYFVDNVNIPRDLRLVYDANNPIQSYKELTSIPYAPVDTLEYKNVLTGGNLVSGSYQIAYRYVNTETGRSSTFSLFTNAIPIYPVDLYSKDFIDEVYGGVPNESTNKSIKVRVNKTSENSSLYNAIELAVMKNTDGSKTPATVAYLTSPSKDWYRTNTDIRYTGEGVETTINIEDIVVDDAPIKTAKTIEIKEGSMFLGNVSYRDLDIKDGEGTFEEGTVKTKEIGLSSDVLKPINLFAGLDPSEKEKVTDGTGSGDNSTEYGYKNPNNCVRYKSTFRGEVYRYGITYMDEYGAWSPPKTVDFSSKTAFDFVDGEGSFTVSSLEWIINRGNTLVTISTSNSSLEFKEGDYLYLQDRGGNNEDDYFVIMNSEPFSSNSYKVEVATLLGWNSFGKARRTIGSQFTHSKSGVDFKYPSREMSPYTILSDDNRGASEGNGSGKLRSLGLSLKGVDNHPAWAKSFAIVRTARQRDILYQSPQIPCVAATPTLNYNGDTDPCTPVSGASKDGSFGAFSLSHGASKNVIRNEGRDLGSYQPSAYLASDTGDTSPSRQPIPLTLVVPPEYMMTSVDGDAFRDDLLQFGVDLKIIDSASFVRTEGMDVDGSGVDTGENPSDQLGLGFRADGKYNYYYQEERNYTGEDSKSAYINGVDVAGRLYSSGTGSSEITGIVPLSNNGEGRTLPETIAPDSDATLLITDVGDFNSVSLQNFGEEVKLQKALALITKEKFGDITYMCARKFEGEQNGGDVWRWERLYYGRNTLTTAKIFYNPDKEAFDTTSTIVTGSRTTFCAAIVNAVKGLEDDRYGDVDDVSNFFSTGSYNVIDSPSDKKDVEVFGGDCFISKSNLKINDTVLAPFSGFIGCEQGQALENTQIRGYRDMQEIISVYLETEVNTGLQADKYGYPVVDKNSIGEFRQDFNYPYHFGYSIDNIIKVFTSKDPTIESENEYPARLVYSDKHTPNSKDNSYSRFRTLAFYDLSETYGGITKLIKLSNDNVYCLQEKGVSVIPIGKNVIEDGSGGQLVINTDTLVNKPQYLLNKNGCQHIRTAISSENNIFFVDARTKEVFKIGEGSGKVSDKGMFTYFEDKLQSFGTIPEHLLSAAFDFSREEYTIHMEGFSERDYFNDVDVFQEPFSAVYSDKIGGWITELRFGDNVKVKKMFSFKNGLIVIGDTSTDFNVEVMYGGDVKGEILGAVEPSEFNVIFTPEGTFAKTFDNLRIDATNRLTEMEVFVYNEREIADRQTGRFNLNVKPRQGGYEVPTLRDEVSNGRMRGKYCECIFYINNGIDSPDVKINNITLKYRMSENRFRNGR